VFWKGTHLLGVNLGVLEGYTFTDTDFSKPGMNLGVLEGYTFTGGEPRCSGRVHIY
jgi:hypothetical protein